MNSNIRIDGYIATLFIYGYIGDDWWEDGSATSDINVAREVKNLEGQVKTLHVRLNCYGGEVKHAWAIYNSLQSTTLEVHTFNDGWVCSAASIIYLAAKVENRHYGELARWMYHGVTNSVWGNVFDFEEVLAVMRSLNKTSAELINKNTKSPVDWMDIREDTWLDISDAISHGLVLKTEQPYVIEPVKQTLLTQKHLSKSPVFSQKVLDSFNNYQNNLKMELQKSPEVTPTAPVQENQPTQENKPAETPVDVTGLVQRLTQMEQKQTEQDTQITGLQQSLAQKTAEVAEKETQITALVQALNGKPGATPEQVNVDGPIVPSEGDEVADLFLQNAQKGNYTAIN